jgi:hypothetical protein
MDLGTLFLAYQHGLADSADLHRVAARLPTGDARRLGLEQVTGLRELALAHLGGLGVRGVPAPAVLLAADGGHAVAGLLLDQYRLGQATWTLPDLPPLSILRWLVDGSDDASLIAHLRVAVQGLPPSVGLAVHLGDSPLNLVPDAERSLPDDAAQPWREWVLTLAVGGNAALDLRLRDSLHLRCAQAGRTLTQDFDLYADFIPYAPPT